MKIYQNQSLNYFANKQKNEEEEKSSDQMKIRLFFCGKCTTNAGVML